MPVLPPLVFIAAVLTLGFNQTGAVTVQNQFVSGQFTLDFLDNNLQPVSSLPVNDGELILKAHVEANGVAVTRGSVLFQYCSLKGLPPNDINRPDEAPKAACDSGEGTWAGLVRTTLDGSGNAFMNFGFVMIPRTVGFRFRYFGQGSGVANDVSDAEDFTWVPVG